MQDLHILPKLRDSLSYLYVEHAIIDRQDSAIEYTNQEGRIMVPAANLCVLLLGPGTSITHAAVKILGENGCSILWVGEDATRFYGQGLGETRKGYRTLLQAKLACDPIKHMEVVLRMYRMRFVDLGTTDLSIEQLRGKEGARVREAYAQASRIYGVPWNGRRYDMTKWEKGDTINRALSAANALMNGICHAAIVSGGYSPALGFIHTGKMLSFVYDIADLYKAEFCIPLSFKIVAESTGNVEARVREACREKFKENKLLDRIFPDIEKILALEDESDPAEEEPYPILEEYYWNEENAV